MIFRWLGEREGDKGTKGVKKMRKVGREFKIRMKLGPTKTKQSSKLKYGVR
jgi:hypothetical protein